LPVHFLNSVFCRAEQFTFNEVKLIDSYFHGVESKFVAEPKVV
jgi:hypothetical protein